MNMNQRLCFTCGALTPVAFDCSHCGAPPDPDEELQETFAQPHLTPARLRRLSALLSWHIRESPHPGIGQWTFFTESMLQPDLEFADNVPERFLPEEEGMIRGSFGPDFPDNPDEVDP